MRWPFGPPHLTLKPSKKNRNKKNKNQKKTNKKKQTKNKKKTKTKKKEGVKNWSKVALKTGPSMLRNKIGLVFNASDVVFLGLFSFFFFKILFFLQGE